ncbi:hypothetical protein VCHC17A1_2541A, partial [Vibrio cholerae HC-17A1]
MLWLISAAR